MNPVQVGAYTIRWIRPEEWPDVRPWVDAADIRPLWLSPENPTTLIAERDGKIVAALSLTWGPWGYGTIDWAVTRPEEGRGAGRVLAKSAFLLLDALGMQGVCSLVSERLPRVLAFHRSLPGVAHSEEKFYLSWKRLGGDGDNGKAK